MAETKADRIAAWKERKEKLEREKLEEEEAELSKVSDQSMNSEYSEFAEEVEEEESKVGLPAAVKEIEEEPWSSLNSKGNGLVAISKYDYKQFKEMMVKLTQPLTLPKNGVSGG